MVGNRTSFVPSELSGLVSAVSVEQLILAGVVLTVTVIANFISDRMIDRAVRRRGGEKHAAKTAKKFSSYIIFSLGLLFVLGSLGLPLSSVGAAIGLIGLGISFALKDIMANFISGMFILISKPFKIGDQIEVEGYEGTIEDIRMRASDVRTYDGRRLIVPNSTLYNSIVVNNTAYGSRRFEVIVGVSYDSDIRKAREMAEKALQEASSVRGSPEPKVTVRELNDSSVDLRLWGWADSERADQVSAASEVTQLVKQKFDEDGIDIPFPIRTVMMEETDR